jgi:hypothetical protein
VVALLVWFVPGWTATAIGRGWSWWLLVSGVVAAVGGAALLRELWFQVRRSSPRWERSDTGITAILGGFAVFLGVSLAGWHAPADDRWAAAVFAPVYLVLAGGFAGLRLFMIRRFPLREYPIPQAGDGVSAREYG